MKRMLPALLTLLLVLVAVSHGTAPLCDISENKAMHQCYGALGQSVFIYILNTNSEMKQLKVFFNDKLFFEYQKGKRFTTICQNHCQVMSNGTLRLDNLTKNHSGIYFIDVFNSDGKSLLKKNISLTIQDLVTPPVLSQLCLSHGEIRVSCSSTGEPPQYSWTLDGRALDGGVAFLSNETQTVILRRNVSGSITCEVNNHVSKKNTTQVLLTCPGLGPPVICALPNKTEIEVRMNASLDAPSLLNNTEIFFRAGGARLMSAVCTRHLPAPDTTTVNPPTPPPQCGLNREILLPVVLGTCLLLLVLLLVTCCLYMKKQKQPKKSQTGDKSEEPQELVYCQVQVVKNKKRPQKREQEPQVVYGEVKVSS